MNVIIAYLETMFSAYPQTPRLLEAKAELLAMMEDAYSGSIAEGLSENEAVGRVITDFGNLDDLAGDLGIANEIHPPAVPAQAVTPAASPTQPATPAHPPITRSEAEGYAQVMHQTATPLATAVALCVTAPAPLIALTTLSGSGTLSITDEVATLIGMISMLALVAIAVLLFVRRSQQLTPYKRILDGNFTHAPSVDRWVQTLATEHSGQRSTRLQIAIVLWILAIVPIFAGALLPSAAMVSTNAWSGVGVSIALIIVALGLFTFLPSNWASATATTITEGGWSATDSGNRVNDKEEASIVGVISAIYWPLLTVIYLAWSFIWDAWGQSWIVWPIGAVLFGALAAGLGAWESYRKAKNR